ncbi:hypothetical protein PHYBOEH_001480 [Phytophthora boehmeriae]|uniref:GPI transamidase component PIG-S n=1 Tax=Phytophthora boehmeriae TaxID=109152 RepID=A0A8T1WT19_9STRA|nr:hypothetical protein PHYBOEH_001480 [Phytophthora boehmeriae]
MAGTRLQIVGAFVLFAALAAPLAWHLTQVERVPLPVERIQMLSWSSSRFSGPVTFEVTLLSLQSDTINKSPTSNIPNVGYSTQYVQSASQLQLALKKSDGLHDTDDVLKSFLPDQKHQSFSIFLLCDDDAINTPILTVGKYRHAWSSACHVTEGDAVHSAIEKVIQNHVYPQLLSVSKTEDTKIARRALHYRLQFSVLKENPSTEWEVEVETLVQQYMGKMLHKIGAVANFTVETQVVQYARLAKEVTSNADGTEFYLNAEELKQFKSMNDFLDVSVLDDREQVLHFMAALPDPVHAPLFIRPDQQVTSKTALATSFELPGWGIAVILNPHALAKSSTKERELQRVMGLFVTELRTLLGVPAFADRQREEDAANHGAPRRSLVFMPSPTDGIADWELDIVMRDRFTRIMQTAIETLQSTVELVEALPELSVLERVQQRVETAVSRLESILCERQQDCVALSDLRSLLAMARQASELTDAAYYDHTMIRQLYFPQEQMLGVYAPLLAPLILPFLLGFVREFKRWKAKRAAKRSKQE